jgi:hypothetical protein
MAYRLKRIADQVMVVTGASSGIGLATAYEGAKRGDAGDGGEVHGESPHHVMASLYTKASMHPVLSALLLAAAGLATSAFLGTRARGAVQ